VTDRKDHRAALLEAAIQCLEQTGYAGTTTRDIVAAAGSHLPSVNYYFGSKDELLNEAIVECCRRWLSRAAELTAQFGKDPSQSLRAVCSELFETLEENRPLMVAFLESLAHAERSEVLRRQVSDQYQEYRHALTRLIESLLPPALAPADGELNALPSLLIATADGLMIQWLLDPSRTPSADELLASLRTVARAVVSTP
jgi:AcrR family transcriptional regulator